MNRIRELREARGLKQSDLGKIMNCSGMTISRYELGQHEIDSATINRLCEIFDVTADYLLCRSSNPKPLISDEDASLIAAYHAADDNIRKAIDALLFQAVEPEGKSAVS